MSLIWNTKNVIIYVPQAEQILSVCFLFFLSFLNVYDMFVSVNLNACEILFSPLCVCLCYEKDYFEKYLHP